MNYTIYPLKNGRCVIAGNHAFLGRNPAERYPYNLYLWLIRGWEEPILVDAGLKDVEEMNRGAAHVLAEPIVQCAGETVQAQLAKFGIGVEDIGWVFITHLHFDHVNELGSGHRGEYPDRRRYPPGVACSDVEVEGVGCAAAGPRSGHREAMDHGTGVPDRQQTDIGLKCPQ
jgi:hypothetical protein